MTYLHRIEALPGDARYAITFHRADGTEQSAVVHLTADGVDVAPASLPPDCMPESELFAATVAAVLAVDAARRLGPARSRLRDVAGGWDVSLGNVVLDGTGTPTCTAHGPMTEDGGVYVCTECEARAILE